MRAIHVLAVALAATACTREAEQKLEDAKQKAKEGVAAIASGAQSQGDAYRRQLETRLTALTARIESLRRSADRLTGEARDRAEDKVKDLEKKRDELVERIRDLGDKSGDALDAAKRGVDDAVSDLESACEDVRDALR